MNILVQGLFPLRLACWVTYTVAQKSKPLSRIIIKLY